MDKALIVIILILLIGILFVTLNQPAEIAVVSMEKLVAESKVAGELQQELTNIGQQMEQEYLEKKDEIENTELESDHSLEQIYNQYLSNKEKLEEQLTNEIRKVIAGLAEKDDYEVILFKRDVHSGGVDITDKVIQALDATGGAGFETESEQ